MIFLCMCLVAGLSVFTPETQASSNLTCDAKADILLIVDSSSSIGKSNYKLQQKFINGLINSFTVGPDDILFAMLIFSRTTEKIFCFDEAANKTHLNSLVDNSQWLGSTTNIAKAFDLGLRMLSTDCPNRPTSQDLVIFITDGVANMDVDKTDLYVRHMKESGAIVMVVGLTDDVDLVALNAIATSTALFTFIDSFDSLAANIQPVADMMCDVVEEDSCNYCKDYDNYHFGFWGNYTSSCYSYKVCKYDPATGKSKTVAEMECPIGTMFNHQSANLGVPCVVRGPNEPCEDDRQPESHEEGECLWKANADDPSLFGREGEAMQSCGPNNFFDEETCECDQPPPECMCMLLVDFDSNTDDQSCTAGEVENVKPMVSLTGRNMPPMGKTGRFRGSRPHMKNGHHLTAFALNGAFSTTCDVGHGQETLTVATWFYYTYVGGKVSSLISYCNNNEGRSLFIEIRGDTICAGISTIAVDPNMVGGNMVEICTGSLVTRNTWFYVSFVYESPEVRLYLTPKADYTSCSTGSPSSTCEPRVTAEQTGCVDSRNCGLNIGAGGDSWADNAFFYGQMDNVQIFRGASYWACPESNPM